MASIVAKPESAPEHCPGTQSDQAGKASACAGCPNQQICATGPKEPDPGIALVKERLGEVQNKILVLSGKGGVGKSTVTALLSRALAARDPNQNVAVLDIDICGPSQPRVLGVADEQVHQSGSGWSPVYVDDNLSVMSIGFLLASPDDAIIWRGPKKNGMIKQFLSEVDWGQLDYLLMDTPPGTSDEHLSAVTYLSQANLTGAILVTTPQEVALLDVRKEIDFCRKTNIKILGVVENMSKFICPCCASQKYFQRIQEVPGVTRCCDEGKNFIEDLPDSPVIKALDQIITRLQMNCRD
ncbi:hypothetical protein GWI33_023000 [Rhynchophorus ferrugineus]|uniref:Cytosolic Fe-S cluster assembly factor NUBP1 homolog n=1 Tax=Rhynchophorus ferrugineus TaxID=354439 RepID=A0A834ITQ7_RHYFE|nr:hypothetical protein GWI33_023000 [Rhynchophorus ferrugineus]